MISNAAVPKISQINSTVGLNIKQRMLETGKTTPAELDKDPAAVSVSITREAR